MLIRPAPWSVASGTVQHRTPAKSYVDVEDLVVLCAQGRLYEVEQWISEGRPIQCERLNDKKLRKNHTPLSAVVSNGFYSLAELLLVNGYNPNGDHADCLSPAIRTKNSSMAELLFRFGADLTGSDFSEVLSTYDRRLMDCFITAGADPCAGNAVAKALESKARPLLGFVKTYKERFPGMQRQIDIALHNFIDTEDEKGVCLMLWLGANPYVKVPRTAWDDEEDEGLMWLPLETAMIRGNEGILLHLLKVPIPPYRVREVFHSASFRTHPEVIRRLLKAGADPNDRCYGRHVLDGYVRALCHSFYQSGRTAHIKNGIEAVRLLAEAGSRWDIDSKDLAGIRRAFLDAESSTVKTMLEIFRGHNVLTHEQIVELTRTPAMKRLFAGESRTKPSPPIQYSSRSAFMEPSHSDSSPPKRGYWKRHWSQR